MLRKIYEDRHNYVEGQSFVKNNLWTKLIIKQSQVQNKSSINEP